MTRAIVSLSGGQDSTTTFYWALREFGHGNVLALSFDYQQRHKCELESAAKVAKLAGVPHTVASRIFCKFVPVGTL